MDFRAVGELIFMSLMGLSTVLAVLFVGARLAIKPILQDYLRMRQQQTDELAEARVRQLEGRVLDLETEVDRVRATADFDRRLTEAPKRDG